MTDKQANDITKEQAIRILHPDTRVEAIDDYEEAGNYEHAYDMAILMAIAALRGPQPDPDTKRCLEWVETTERLPVKEDAGIDGMVAFCYRDEWDCFHRLEKWDEINPQKHTYWHKMLKAPEVEG